MAQKIKQHGIIIVFAVLLILAGGFYLYEAYATGTVTSSEELISTVKKITFDWLSDASGDATATTTAYFSGVIERIVFIPDSGGTQPSALYDVTITDDNSIDICDSEGTNLSATTSFQIQGLGGYSAVANSQLNLTVSNAGNAKGGQVIIYIR